MGFPSTNISILDCYDIFVFNDKWNWRFDISITRMSRNLNLCEFVWGMRWCGVALLVNWFCLVRKLLNQFTKNPNPINRFFPQILPYKLSNQNPLIFHKNCLTLKSDTTHKFYRNATDKLIKIFYYVIYENCIWSVLCLLTLFGYFTSTWPETNDFENWPRRIGMIWGFVQFLCMWGWSQHWVFDKILA